MRRKLQFHLFRSTVTSDKAKHTDVPFHNSHRLNATGAARPTETATLESLADVVAKALPSEKRQYLT